MRISIGFEAPQEMGSLQIGDLFRFGMLGACLGNIDVVKMIVNKRLYLYIDIFKVLLEFIKIKYHNFLTQGYNLQ